jgi:pyruvate dehydrogenase complex dehydrogenase (E1) component
VATSAPGLIIADSDLMTIVPEQVIRFVPGLTLCRSAPPAWGGRSTPGALRRHFEVDTGHVVEATRSPTTSPL